MLSLNAAAQSGVAAGDRIIGYWTNGSETAKIHIYKSKNTYSGKIVELKNPRDKAGNIQVDKYNPEEKFRTRTIMGMVLMKGFEYDGKDVWDEGEIYDPNSGKTYRCILTMAHINKLFVKGYVGYSWMGMSRTDTWVRDK